MEHTRTDQETKHWVVLIAVDEHENPTRARARFSWRGTTLEGIGRAGLDTTDDHAAEIRDELAVARALSNLANQLFAASVSDIKTATDHPAPTLTPLTGARE